MRRQAWRVSKRGVPPPQLVLLEISQLVGQQVFVDGAARVGVGLVGLQRRGHAPRRRAEARRGAARPCGRAARQQDWPAAMHVLFAGSASSGKNLRGRDEIRCNGFLSKVGTFSS